MITDERWLRLMAMGELLGCHQMPERSFFYKGYQFPVCARCTGVILSATVATILFAAKKRVSIRTGILLSGLMFLDWFVQFLGIRESTNLRRLLTGILGGFGYTTLHLYFYSWIMRLLRREQNLASHI